MKPVLEIKNVSKCFRINESQQPYLSFRDSITGLFKTSTGGGKQDFWALSDVSFDVMPGDTVGVIGKNGAGKSTLLKILSRITPPTLGGITVRGRIASLLEVGTGFHPELSGRENVYLNGSILGMKRQEINKNFDEIVAFAGVEKFIDTPLKHYSSGMQLRLAFAVAAFLENEVLIIDEVLAVGDAEFQKKCIGKMDDVSKSGRTILFVSHNMQAVNTLCSRAVILEKGNVKFNGSSKEAIRIYNEDLIQTNNEWNGNSGDENVRLLKTWVKPLNDGFYTDNSIEVGITVDVLQDVSNLVLGFLLVSEYGEELAYCLHDDYVEQPSSQMPKGRHTKIFHIPANTLAKGTYFLDIDVGIHNAKRIVRGDGGLAFNVMNRGNLGCRFPVEDVKGRTSLFRPNWTKTLTP